MVENVLRIVQPTKPFPLTQSEVFNRDPDTVRAECITVGYRVLETGGGRPASQLLTAARVR